jgi:biotin operon repressor
MATKKRGTGNQLAKRIGVSRQRVSQLKQAGKLKTTGAGIDVARSERMHAERLAAQQTSPSRQIKEHYEAKVAKFEFERLMGQWVEVAAVERDAFRNGRQIRDGFLGFADRLSALLAAESDEHKIHAILTKEIRQLLALLATPEEQPAG